MAARKSQGFLKRQRTFFARGRELKLSARLAPGGVARLGLIVRRIETGQLDALLDLAEHPALVKLVLGALVRDEIHEVLRDDDGAVIVDYDQIARKNGAAAAADRLLPADEGQSVDRGRRRHAGTPYRQRAREHAGAVAQH